MIGRKEEAEVIIMLDQLDQMAHICVCSWPAMYRKMLKLYGQSLDGANPERAARWVIPIKAVSMRRLAVAPRSPRKLTGRPFVALKRAAEQQSGEKLEAE